MLPQVRRAVMDESGTTVVGAADGVIIGWLPESVSDYVFPLSISQLPLAPPPCENLRTRLKQAFRDR
jgi:hypothetical protein